MQFEIFRPVTVFDIFSLTFQLVYSLCILKISDPGKQMMNIIPYLVKLLKIMSTHLLDEIWSKWVFV